MERYLVFARSTYAEPLSFQGSLEVPAGESPQQPALDAHGAEWVELVLVPEHAAFWAIEEAATNSAEARP